MRERGLQGRRKRRFCRTTDSNHAHPVAPNVLERNFETKAPNEAWVGDVTYIATGEGWLYLAVLLDLFSRRVVGWATSATNDRFLALAALDQALRSRRRTAWTRAPHRPRQPLRQRRLPRGARPTRHRREHEPHRRLLRQRRRRELLRDAQDRACRPRDLRRPRRRRTPRSPTTSRASTTRREGTRISTTSVPSNSNCGHTSPLLRHSPAVHRSGGRSARWACRAHRR